MSKICVVHGVGFIKENNRTIKTFCSTLAHKTGAAVELYHWQHPGQIPDDPERDSFLFRPIRRFVQEVIMDYTHVLNNMGEIASKFPRADFYVGYSAGGVIVPSLTSKPQVLMASPWQLVQNVRLRMTPCTTLNVMYYRDPVAAPLEGTANAVVNTPRCFPLLDPVIGHLQYWDNPAVMDLIVDWYHKHMG